MLFDFFPPLADSLANAEASQRIMVQKASTWTLNIVEKLGCNLANFAFHHLSSGQKELLK